MFSNDPGFGVRAIPKEEYAVILDFLSHGHSDSRDRNPIVQVIGETHLTLLELVPRKGENMLPGERVYIGPDKRDKVHHVLGRIPFDKLTLTARSELENFITKHVTENEAKYVEFFNKCGAVSTRLHTLEILPGIGKKHMMEILEQRKEKVFESFEDIKQRVRLIPDPRLAIVARIMEEIEGKDKYKLFVG